MPTKPKGGVQFLGGRWYARVTLVDGSRCRYALPIGISGDKAEAVAKALSERVRRERLTKVQLGALKAPPSAAKDQTVKEWSVLWMLEREAKGLTSCSDYYSMLNNHVLPLIGKFSVKTLPREEIEKLVNRLDDKVRGGKIGWKTASNIWVMVRKMFSDASSSKRPNLRVRTDDPCEKVQPPDRGKKRSNTYLYPTELLKVVECDDVPVRRRQAYALAIYLGCRFGELATLTCEDVDFDGGVVLVHQAADRRARGAVKGTKSGRTRRVPIEPAIRPLLIKLTRQAGGTGRFVPVYERRSMADKLRFDLKRAHVTRAELFASDQTRKNLTFHDLRATTATWYAVRGDDPLKIQRRLGHASLETTQLYIREAENLTIPADSVFPNLPMGLLAAEADADNDADKPHKVASRSPEKTLVKPLSGKRVSNPTLAFGTGEKSGKMAPLQLSRCHFSDPKRPPTITPTIAAALFRLALELDTVTHTTDSVRTTASELEQTARADALRFSTCSRCSANMPLSDRAGGSARVSVSTVRVKRDVNSRFEAPLAVLPPSCHSASVFSARIRVRVTSLRQCRAWPFSAAQKRREATGDQVREMHATE